MYQIDYMSRLYSGPSLRCHFLVSTDVALQCIFADTTIKCFLLQKAQFTTMCMFFSSSGGHNTRETLLSTRPWHAGGSLVGLHMGKQEAHGPWHSAWETTSSRSCTYTLFLPQGSNLSLFSLYEQQFLRYVPIFKIAIFGHETWPLAKVPEVAQIPSFSPRGSKLTLF